MNLDLLIPVAIAFILMRLRNIFNIPQKLLSGLRLFVRVSAAFPAASTKPKVAKDKHLSADLDGVFIEESISKLQLTMIELDTSTVQKVKLLTFQLFYEIYEVLCNFAILCITSHIWSGFFHCWNPNAEYSFWSTLISFGAAVLSSQSLLQMLYLTGIRAKETQLAIVFGCITFLGVLLLVIFLPFTINSSFNESTLHLAVHINAMLSQIEEGSTQYPIDTLQIFVQTTFAGIIGLMVSGIVLPAIRFSQLFLSMNFGSKYELVESKWKVMLWLDYILPLVVGSLFSPLSVIIMKTISQSISQEDNNSVCDNSLEFSCSDGLSNTYGTILFNFQIVSVLLMILVRISTFRLYMQRFLDDSARTVAVHLSNSSHKDTSEHEMLQSKIKARSEYLIPAATQFIATPVLLLSLIVLLHKSNPVGLEICTSTLNLFGLDSTSVKSAALFNANYNSTALAFETASQPYLSAALQALVGLDFIPNENPRYNPVSVPIEKTTKVLQQFLFKLSSIYFLPSKDSMTLLKGIIMFHSILWFIVNTIAQIFWKYYPMYLMKQTLSKTL
eukprot:gene4333-6134_t